MSLPGHQHPPHIVVSGGTRRVGGALSIALAGEGLGVTALYESNEPGARALRAVAHASQLKIQVLRCDITAPEDVAGVADGIWAAGVTRVAVVHAAAARRVDVGVVQLKPGELTRHAAVAAGGLANLVGAFYPGMSERAWGRFVAVSSTAIETIPRGYGPYVAAKAGMESLARSAAIELGSVGITANVVRLGRIHTRGDDGLARPETVRPLASAVRWLASAEADGVSGATIAVDGGNRFTQKLPH